MEQLTTLSKIIRGTKAKITSWITKYKENRAASEKKRTNFSLTFKQDLNKIVVHEGEPYRVFINEDDVTIYDKYESSVTDFALIVALLEYCRENMTCR